MENRLMELKGELTIELSKILDYWKNNTVDLTNGGFYGNISQEGIVDGQSPKGLVLNARILYAFAAGYRATKQAQYLQMAQRAFHYLLTYFHDRTFGGMYWSVDATGKPLETKKQVYGIAFCIYALSEFHAAMESKEALVLAKELFELLENKAIDKTHGGYFEAFTQGWENLKSPKLSEKDLDSPKSMNTHLHVLEGYASLYKVWPNQRLKDRIQSLLQIFKRRILSNSGHLQLFFSADWTTESDIISYGHDIEASWLIWEASLLVEENNLKANTRDTILKIANAALEGLDKDGSLLNESNLDQTHWNRERHWWQQAETMVGCMNAWQLTGDPALLEIVLANWAFIKAHLLDKEHGEWFWGINDNYSKMAGEAKAGFWKCPYHNSRMCIEVIRRMY